MVLFDAASTRKLRIFHRDLYRVGGMPFGTGTGVPVPLPKSLRRLFNRRSGTTPWTCFAPLHGLAGKTE